MYDFVTRMRGTGILFGGDGYSQCLNFIFHVQAWQIGDLVNFTNLESLTSS